MKFPSLSRIPRHKRFNFEPRYYDPVNEDIQNRTAEAKVETKYVESNAYRQRIRSAYSTRVRRAKSADFMQWLLILILTGTFFGWIYFGNVAIYVFAIVFPIYIFLRTRKFFR